MILRDISFSNPQENILFDDVLLHLAEKDDEEMLRFWESERTFVVLGRISSLIEDVNLKEVKDARIPVLRRSSGGGTVLQGKGCFNYSLILNKTRDPRLMDIRSSYGFILGKVVEALSQGGVEAKFFPISDIALVSNKKKFSGNAQKRGRKYVLHHGTILYDFPLKDIGRYLRMPRQIPEYREGRSHHEFVTNIPTTLSVLKKELGLTFGATIKKNEIISKERTLLNEFVSIRPVMVDIDL